MRNGENVAVRRIDIESKEEIDSAMSALTLAFACDPVMRWMYPSADDYLRHYRPLMEIFGGASLTAKTAWIGDDSGGAALWFPPGVHGDGDSIGQQMFSSVAEEKHETLGAVLQQMDDHHPKEPHWYLAVIGVDTAHQGKGLGAQLMRAGLECCDADGLPAYLESSNPANISLYERHGFRRIGEIQVGDGPLLRPMLRPAAGS